MNDWCGLLSSILCHHKSARRGGRGLSMPLPALIFATALLSLHEGSVASGGYCCGHEYLQAFALNRRWLTKHKRQRSTVALPPHSTLPSLTSLLPSYFRSPDNASAVDISHRSRPLAHVVVVSLILDSFMTIMLFLRSHF